MPQRKTKSSVTKARDQNAKWRRADDQLRKGLPTGVKLVRTLRGHTKFVGRVTWSPDGQTLASTSADGTIRVWDAETGRCLSILKALRHPLNGIAFDPASQTLATLSHEVNLWEPRSGKLLRTFGDGEQPKTLAFDPTGQTMVTVGRQMKLWDLGTGEVVRTFDESSHLNVDIVTFDRTGSILATAGIGVSLWNVATGKKIGHLEAESHVYGVAFDPTGQMLVTGTEEQVVKIWEVATGKLLRTLEGHTSVVDWAEFSSDGRLLGSKSNDDTFRLWRCDSWASVAVISELNSHTHAARGFAFHPRLPLLATVGSDPRTQKESRDRVIHIWELDLTALLEQPAEPSAHYVNAKVVLVGDTGVGKSGLSLVLNNEPFTATESTPGRRVWTLDSRAVQVGEGIRQNRETLLWDLAGQPGYRVIHQLHLNEVAVALVVFDARSETDPLAGVRHWERALRLAQQRQGTMGVAMRKFLVSARNDRGGVSIGEERLQAILKEFGFDSYFKTSAKEGWHIKELREAIDDAIVWENLPEVSSSQLFADIKSFLLSVKNTGRLLAPAGQLYDEFALRYADAAAKVPNIRDQFDTCVGRLENRDLIRRLTFGGYVLLQPELLDAYASAMVNTAKEEPDGLGSMAEEIALAGKFFVPKEQRVTDPTQEQLLLHATVEELVKHDLALRENADDGRHLVFPSQFNRDYEDAPEPKGKTVAITFDGPVQSLYSTLAVRLGHSGLFTTGRAEMWRNAAVFTAKAGGKCGLFVHEFAEARGRLILFFDELASMETQFHFEEFVRAHSQRRALEGTLDLVRFFVCSNGHPVPDNYVRLLRAQHKSLFDCPCGVRVSLAEPKERLRFTSEVEAMDESADRQRDFDAFVMSAKGETSTKGFHEWAGGGRVTLAIVFTDVVGSTAMGEEIRDASMNEVRRAHFAQSRKLIGEFNGREIKTIGDSFMAAFKSVDAALDFAISLQEKTGHPQVQIRAGVHIGPMHIEEGDVFGGTVNFAARVIGSIKGAEIWISDRAKDDIDRLGAKQHSELNWKSHKNVGMKGFPGLFRLWSLTSQAKKRTPIDDSLSQREKRPR